MSQPQVVRIDRMKATIRSANMSGILLFSPANVSYLSNGFIPTITSHTIIAVLTLEMPTPVLLVHVLLEVAAHKAKDCYARFYSYGNSNGIEGYAATWQTGLTDVLAQSPRQSLTIGVENDIPRDLYRELTGRFPDAVFIPCSSRIQRLRSIKDETEISNCQKATDIAKVGVATAIAQLQTRSNEEQAVRAAKAAMRRCLADRYPRDKVIAVGSPRSGLVPDPLQCYVLTGERKFFLVAPPSSQAPKNQVAIVRCTVAVNAYYSSVTRTTAIGQAPDWDAKMLRDVDRMHSQSVSRIRPGVTFNRTYFDASDFLKDNNHDAPDEIGHLTGLDPREGDVLDATTTLQFEPGMVVELRSSIAQPPTAKVEISDTVVVTQNGCRCL